LEPEEIARAAAGTAEDKLAHDVVILDMRELSILYDYWVVCSAPTRIQTRDIARAIEERFAHTEVPRPRVQGYQEGAWVLLDYGTVIVHIFLQREREFYNLEALWRRAPVLYRAEPARSLPG
jgi:ribosome-associated protein